MATIREEAIKFAMRAIQTATDWQDVEAALIDSRFGQQFDSDEIRSIIADAEKRLGDKVPY